MTRMTGVQLLLGLLAVQLGTQANLLPPGNAWPARSHYERNSRNLLRPLAAAVDLAAGAGGPAYASTLNNNEFAQLFAMEQQQQQQQEQREQREQQREQEQKQQPGEQQALRQAPAEIYGIVEPLIEDTPCANRACVLNDDCCPTGVCVHTYNEGKCVYVFGRQRDQCQRHADCAPGSACMLAPQQGIWRCESEPPALTDVFHVRPKQPLGGDCNSSSDCQVVNGMCCQQQRLHHRATTKLSCGYFRDAFDCVDVAHERVGGIFQQRHN